MLNFVLLKLLTSKKFSIALEFLMSVGFVLLETSVEFIFTNNVLRTVLSWSFLLNGSETLVLSWRFLLNGSETLVLYWSFEECSLGAFVECSLGALSNALLEL